MGGSCGTFGVAPLFVVLPASRLRSDSAKPATRKFFSAYANFAVKPLRSFDPGPRLPAKLTPSSRPFEIVNQSRRTPHRLISPTKGLIVIRMRKSVQLAF